MVKWETFRYHSHAVVYIIVDNINISVEYQNIGIMTIWHLSGTHISQFIAINLIAGIDLIDLIDFYNFKDMILQKLLDWFQWNVCTL